MKVNFTLSEAEGHILALVLSKFASQNLTHIKSGQAKPELVAEFNVAVNLAHNIATQMNRSGTDTSKLILPARLS